MPKYKNKHFFGLLYFRLSMTKRYIVLDQNTLRKPYLEKLIVDDPSIRIILPDMAFLEMTKTPQWELTLRNSLACLAMYPQRVHVCLSVNEALKRELANLKPINGHMMHHEATSFLRNLLEGFRTNTPSLSLERIRENPNRQIDELKRQHLNHSENKERMAGIIYATAAMLPEETKKRLRSDKVERNEWLQLVQVIGMSLLPDILAENGIERHKSAQFIRQCPMTLRYMFLKVWRCLRWLRDRGFDSQPPKAVTNDEFDDQYILAATFFQDLLSEDKIVNEAYGYLRDLITKLV